MTQVTADPHKLHYSQASCESKMETGGIVWPEDAVYEQLKVADEGQHSGLYQELLRHVKRHAEILIYQQMREQVPDLVDEIVTAVFRSLKDFREASQFSTWVHGIALNKISEEIRRRCSRRKLIDETISLDDAEKKRRLDDESQNWSLSVDLDLVREDLSTDEAILFDLKREGAGDQEIAHKWGKTVEAVESRWRRLRSKLQNKYAPKTTEK